MYPQVFGKYVLERELARGGMARVVLATLRGAGGFEKKLVVKQIRDELASDDEFVKRFVDEAKTTVALAHPNIVPVYELGVELGTYFLAMEYVEGASLADLVRARPLSPEEGAYVGVEVCRALDYAHRRMNVVHRDVTPRNVMVDYEGLVKVIDFGISAPVATAPTGEGVFGSPGHMPPEQMAGQQLTPAADVFAVAVLLMELWSGKAPFRRRTREDIEAAMRASHPHPGDADPRLAPLDEVIASAMSLDPAARPQQADDLGRALRKFLSGVDLGDVARQLGARVKELREHPLPPTSDVKKILQRPPSRPTATQVGTKTFAARSEVGKWDGARARAEETPVAAGTRRIDSAKPPAPAREPETVATRPIETDPSARKSAAPAPRRAGLFVAMMAGGVGLAVAAFYLGKGAGTVEAPPTVPALQSALTRGLVTPPAPSAATTAPASATAAATGPATAATAPTAPATAAGTSTSSAAAAERATLTLLGDGTFVAVDGVTRGPSPIKVAVEPGAHTVVFTFPATGESKGTSLSLKAGERATLRSDFTGATPTVRLQR